MQTEQLLCWSGMTDTEHSTTSSSNEEEEVNIVENIVYLQTFRPSTGAIINA